MNKMMTPLFAGKGLSKSYGAQRALDHVDFEVAAGEVVGLVGANGAGKSTLLKILAGAIAPDEGELSLDGQPIRMNSMRDAAERGIALVSQELNLFPALSIAENLAIVGAERGTMSRAEREKTAGAALADLGLDISMGMKLERLSLGDRQLVEIARALLQNPRVLILDEPTSALHKREKERLLALVKRLSGTGVGIVYVSHFLEELLEVATGLVVLRDGKKVPVEIVPAKERLGDVVSAMLGETAAQNLRHDTSRDAGDSVSRSSVLAGPLQISGLEGPLQLRIPDWTVPAGAVVGVAGLAGAGVEELFALLFGRLQARRGKIVLPSGGSAPRSAAEAVKRGVAYIPADRKRIGLMLKKSVAENIWSVRTLVQGRDGFFLSNGRLNAIAAASCNLLGVKAAGTSVSVEALSGGNQQKIVFAKWLEANPSLVLLDDPTRGVDIGAKREMHRIIRRLAQDGRVVLMYSSDPLELVNVAERVHVFVDGNLRHELRGAALTEHALVSAMNTRAATDMVGAARPEA